ncbi:hypothetical protein P5F71_08470 [Clostridium perfringens]|nr:hypothetical protein [Clostridium perfringens]
MITIPDMKKIVPYREKLGKEVFNAQGVLDFYLEDNKIKYFLNNNGDSKNFRCIKNYSDKYKLFAYKTLGVTSYTKYFILDIEKQEVFEVFSGYIEGIKAWIEYLLDGGSIEKAKEENKKSLEEFDPCNGI